MSAETKKDFTMAIYTALGNRGYMNGVYSDAPFKTDLDLKVNKNNETYIWHFFYSSFYNKGLFIPDEVYHSRTKKDGEMLNSTNMILSALFMRAPWSKEKFTIITNSKIQFENLVNFKGKLSLKLNLSIALINTSNSRIFKEENITMIDENEGTISFFD